MTFQTDHYGEPRALSGGGEQLLDVAVATSGVVDESRLEGASQEPADAALTSLRSEASAEMLAQIKRLSKIVRISRTSKLGADVEGQAVDEPIRASGGAGRVFRPLEPSRSPLRDRLLNGSAFRSGHRNAEPKSDP